MSKYVDQNKNVLRGRTNFTSCAGLNNSAIILPPGMRSGVSMLAFKGGINGYKLYRRLSQHQKLVFGAKKGCFVFVGV